MTIKNPVLRFAAGLVVSAAAVVAVIFLLRGIGSLLEPWYAQLYPFLYEEEGYGFWKAFWLGLAAVWVLVVGGYVFFGVFYVARGIGNRVFGPEEE